MPRLRLRFQGRTRGDPRGFQGRTRGGPREHGAVAVPRERADGATHARAVGAGHRNLSVVFDDGTLVDIAERDVQRDPPRDLELEVTEPNEAARAVLRDQGITVAAQPH